MGWFRRAPKLRAATAATGPYSAELADVHAHLADFARTKIGVEMYVEPRTSVTPTTVVLVATSGEWTRRRVGTPQDAGQLARKLEIPVYDVQQTGYPARMRAWTAAQRAAERQAQREREQRRGQSAV